jgi:hypothetical protein
LSAPYNPPVKGTDFVTYVQLKSMAVAGEVLTNPTIEAGDFTVSKDDGSVAALATTPTVSPAGSKWVKVTVSATEKNCDNCKVDWSDLSDPKVFADDWLCIPTTAA